MWGFRNFEYLCIPVPVVQWIEFQIPVLKIGVRIPSGTQILPSKRTKACKLTICGLFVFISIPIHSIIRIKTVRNSVSQFLTYCYSLKAH